MSLLNKVSLLMTPNAVKESKVYSIIPSSGNGDLDFTRATTATLTNDAGLIENVPYNLTGYSEDFANAYWTKQELTVLSKNTIAPNGTLTADKIIPSTLATTHQIISPNLVSFQQTCTITFFVKAAGYNTVTCLDGANGNIFNLTTGAVGTIGVSVGSMIAKNDGWWECKVVAAVTRLRFYIPNAGSTTAGDGTSGVFLWGAQFVTGNVVKPYFPTTDRLNVPRLNYDVAGGCPSILLEPQRMNLALQSEDFSAVNWATTTATITTNSDISPSGVQNADRLTVTALDGQIQYVATVVSGQTYTASFWIKRISGTGQASIRSIENINTPITITNQWARYSVTTTASTTSGRVGVNLVGLGGVISIWGAQLELGSYPTSYIPTTTSSVTRNQDVSSKSGISDLIGQTEGVMFIESAALFNDLTSRYISISDGTSNNRILLFYNNVSNVITLASVSNGTVVISGISYTISDETQFAKIAVRYSNTLGYSLWVNGVNRISSALTTLPLLMSRFGFDSSSGGATLYAKVKQVQLYKTYLSDIEMTQLTTL